MELDFHLFLQKGAERPSGQMSESKQRVCRPVPIPTTGQLCGRGERDIGEIRQNARQTRLLPADCSQWAATEFAFLQILSSPRGIFLETPGWA